MIATTREWYIIVGLAKTGTTVVARTLARTLQINKFCMEPKSLTDIEPFAEEPRLTIKIIFDAWVDRLDDLTKVCSNDAGSHTPTVLCAIRDPRDELVSRLHYFAYNFFATRPTTPEQRAACLSIFQRKEASPASVGVLEMEDEIRRTFGAGFRPGPHLHGRYADFVDNVISRSNGQAYLIRYEDFVSQAISEPHLQSMLAAAQDVHPFEQRVRRTASSGAWHAFFTDRDTQYFNRYFEAFLRKFGYPLEQHHGSGLPVSSATGSEYVSKLIDEARVTFEQRMRGLPI